MHLGHRKNLGGVSAAPVVGQPCDGADRRHVVLVRHQTDNALQHQDADDDRQHNSAMGPEIGHPLNNDPY